MAKRQASNQLNHDNWDQEEEPEDPGVFKKVSDVELSQRVIKTAKRRFQKESTTNPFASFQGFVNKNTTTSTNNNISSSFSNFSSTHTISNGNLNTKSNNSINSLTEKVVVDNLQENHEVQSKDSLRDNEYYRLLKGLNESLAQWIQQHVEKNALCDFTPVFRDYEKHLQDLETRFPPVCDKPTASSVSNVSFSGNSSSENVTDNLKVPLNTTKSSTSSAYTVPNTTFSFCNNSVNSSNPIKYTFSNLSTTTTTSQTSTTSTTSTKITFGALNSSSSSMTGSPSFKFGLQAPTVSFGNIPSSTSAGAATTTTTTTTTTTSINTVFSINTNKPKLSTETFSFNSAVTQNQERKEIKDNEESAEDDDNTEPPKNEFTPVVEKEALYSKRKKFKSVKRSQESTLC
ncbi:nuclear pore complex protein Nup50-like isoform X1 [Centruroides sculpturatus]|uniref:nuclear pore complex protein Nup50-like isoform X1 n=2 Tax=Centruroides sculpturatus TaxID=218467 RepID=UPI000C6D04BD|nr:nuclear pore complex protein Nup50-like isoform X1 [Centruroides sculpturatus]XP_023244824.1 nuclear pore complex protein Nup50-like isoform X1 [Centruroides sculpturatus]XP_023244825.1 nuclear pore complex protein Nup50-like isoform X1 [Centruroides sculpturatus]